MHAKLAQLRRLLDDGYQIEDISTEGRDMEAVLVRRGQHAVVHLDRGAAEALLFRDDWKRRRDLWLR